MSKIGDLEIEVMSIETELLKTLESIDGTLKRIEQLIKTDRNNSTPEESGDYIKEAVQTAIHDTFQ